MNSTLVVSIVDDNYLPCLYTLIFPIPRASECPVEDIWPLWTMAYMHLFFPHRHYRFLPATRYEQNRTGDADSIMGAMGLNISDLTFPNLALTENRTKDMGGYIGPFVIQSCIAAWRQNSLRPSVSLGISNLVLWPIILPLITAYLVSHLHLLLSLFGLCGTQHPRWGVCFFGLLQIVFLRCQKARVVDLFQPQRGRQIHSLAGLVHLLEGRQARLLFSSAHTLEKVYYVPDRALHVPEITRRLIATRSSTPPILAPESAIRAMLSQRDSGLVYMTNHLDEIRLRSWFPDLFITPLPEIVIEFGVSYTRINDTELPVKERNARFVRRIILQQELQYIINRKVGDVKIPVEEGPRVELGRAAIGLPRLSSIFFAFAVLLSSAFPLLCLEALAPFLPALPSFINTL